MSVLQKMLKRRLTACLCASTSTAPPCLHSRQITTNSELAPTPSSSLDQAIAYPAPLWEGHFKSRGVAWSRWMAKSRVGIPPPSPSPLPPVPPPPEPSRASHRDLVDKYNGAEVRDFLALREGHSGKPLHSRSRDDVIGLVEYSKARQMPLVAHLVIDDLRGAMAADPKGGTKGQRSRLNDAAFIVEGVTSRDLQGSYHERAKAGEATSDLGGTAFVPPRGLKEIVGAEDDVLESAPVELEGKERSAEPEPSVWFNARRVLEDLVESRASRDEPLPLELQLGREGESDVARLEELWDAFASDATFTPSLDLHLALAFAHYLTTPTCTTVNTPTDKLPLAIKVLQSLFDTTVSDTFLADPPSFVTASGEPLPAPASVQFVVLRTVAAIAIDSSLFTLATSAIQSLTRLRATYASSHVSDEENLDVEFMEDALHTMLDHLAGSRLSTYRPTATSPTHPLLLSHSLLSSHHVSSSTCPSINVLDSFADEAVARDRWDLLHDVWTWFGRRVESSQESRQQWSMDVGHRRKLLTFLLGRSNARFYGASSLGVPDEKSFKSVRAVSAFDLAAETLLKFQSEACPWRDEEKCDWLEEVVALEDEKQRGYKSQLRARHHGSPQALAQGFYDLFADGTTTFPLRASTLLALVRISTAEARPFVERLVGDFVGLYTSPNSPFSQAAIPSFALTTMAQAYILLGDLRSAGQVYNRMLAQKMLPDKKDVLTIVQAAVTLTTKAGLATLSRLHTTGVVLEPEIQ
ncbi:hypothetical protein MNV49_004991 [Pseudohyphozyma bogoriensis]|nr:hypothetical protein MNV49_004991 [Pseudohyphozyma bogoriensis]